MKAKRMIRIIGIVGALLLIPFIANFVFEGEGWNVFDFIVAGSLLLGAGFVYEIGRAQRKNKMYRAALAIAIGTALFLIWVNLAVGLIGNESNPANMLYLGVIGVLVFGSLIARLRAHTMNRVLKATALAQFLVPFIALGIWKPPIDYGVVAVLILNSFFAVLWLASAYFFKRAASSTATSS